MDTHTKLLIQDLIGLLIITCLVASFASGFQLGRIL